MMKKTVALVCAVLVAACSAQPRPDATHYWESDEASHTRYNSDNSACAAEGKVQAGIFDASSPSFEDYKDCMISRGYVLRTY